jgi:hypothetical protein
MIHPMRASRSTGAKEGESTQGRLPNIRGLKEQKCFFALPVQWSID